MGTGEEELAEAGEDVYGRPTGVVLSGRCWQSILACLAIAAGCSLWVAGFALVGLCLESLIPQRAPESTPHHNTLNVSNDSEPTPSCPCTCEWAGSHPKDGGVALPAALLAASQAGLSPAASTSAPPIGPLPTMMSPLSPPSEHSPVYHLPSSAPLQGVAGAPLPTLRPAQLEVTSQPGGVIPLQGQGLANLTTRRRLGLRRSAQFPSPEPNFLLDEERPTAASPVIPAAALGVAASGLENAVGVYAASTSSPTPPSASLGTIPSDNSASTRSSAACRDGDTCAFGPGWCRSAKSLRLEQPSGFCTRGACNGPTVVAYPNSTCSNPGIKATNVLDLLKGLPEVWLGNLRNWTGFNAWLEGVLEFNALADLAIHIDEVFGSSIELNFESASGQWLVGCWPPQRYVVVSGTLRLPAGRVNVRVGGLDLRFSFYGLSVHFQGLRCELECRDGQFVLASVAQGQDKDREVEVTSFSAEGELNAMCEMRWSFMCLALGAIRPRLSAEVVARIPKYLAWQLSVIRDLVLGPGCHAPYHNTVALLPYSSRKCCEAAFAQDRNGCLVGGQFNGRVLSPRQVADRVLCEHSGGAFTARCDTIPGNYTKFSPGICREGGLPTWTAATSNPGWKHIISKVHLLVWADFLLTLAACWSCMLCCCRSYAYSEFSDDFIFRSKRNGQRRPPINPYSPLKNAKPVVAS